MNIQAEISYYPLGSKHTNQIIKNFITQLQAPGITVRTGNMSTLINGDSAIVFPVLERAFCETATGAPGVLIIKTSNTCPALQQAQDLPGRKACPDPET